jgi:hypothetical protein
MRPPNSRVRPGQSTYALTPQIDFYQRHLHRLPVHRQIKRRKSQVERDSAFLALGVLVKGRRGRRFAERFRLHYTAGDGPILTERRLARIHVSQDANVDVQNAHDST